MTVERTGRAAVVVAAAEGTKTEKKRWNEAVVPAAGATLMVMLMEGGQVQVPAGGR